MKVAVPVLIALTALVIGSALVRGRAREEGPALRPKAAGSAPLPLKPLPVCTSTTGSQAVRIIGLYREQRGLRELLGGELRAADERRHVMQPPDPHAATASRDGMLTGSRSANRCLTRSSAGTKYRSHTTLASYCSAVESAGPSSPLRL